MPETAKPKVAYVLPEYDPDTGSHFFHVYDLVRQAAGSLDLLVVIERAGGDSSRLGVPAYVQRFSWPPLRFLEMFLVLFLERLRGRRRCYTHYSFYGALASWLAFGLTGGRAYYWNSGMPWLYRRPWFTERVLRFVLRRTILVTDPSSLAQEYRQRYRLRADRIRIVPHYISVRRFRDFAVSREEARGALGLPADGEIALFVHRLSRRKGAHLVPEIAAAVIRQEPRAMLIVVGDGPERENLESRIQNLELPNRVRMVGEVPQRSIVPYFRAADVFLMPSEEEGFPHALLEAMAAGVPYVAADVGGVGEITPPELRPYLLPAGDAAGFAEGILRLLHAGAERRARLGAAEQERVMRYDTAAILPQFLSLFR